MRPRDFVAQLQGLSFADTFNPYSDCCFVHDLADAPTRRADALREFLRAAVECEVDSIWIGRDLGHRGGRRTGLALTDDVHVQAHARRWGVTAQRATKGQPVAERTAAVVWSVLDEIDIPVFLWNVFPLHPHEPDDPFTNRAHNAGERAVGEELLAALILLLRPSRLIAVGNDAAKTAYRLAGSLEVIRVRHPSYGGQNQFIAEIDALYHSGSAGRRRRLL